MWQVLNERLKENPNSFQRDKLFTAQKKSRVRSRMKGIGKQIFLSVDFSMNTRMRNLMNAAGVE